MFLKDVYMELITVVILSVLGAVALIGIWAVVTYNRFVHLKALLDEGWSGIDVQLKRRYDLIPNLVATVKGYGIHEKTVLEEVVRLRSAAMGATQVDQKTLAEAGLTQALKTLFAVAEQYPNLKANENYSLLQKELSLIEQEIQLARRYYNGAARNYNTAVVQFPARVIASFGSFLKVPYFEIGSAQERDVPKVQF
jgi:LemA protein